MVKIHSLSRILAHVFVVITLSAAAQSEPIKLKFGSLAPLTGDFANYGKEIQQGIEVARTDLAAEGIELQVVYEDACLPAGEVAAAKRMISVEHIQSVTGSYCVIGMTPSAPLFNAAKIPVFHTSAVAQELLKGGDWIFSTNVAVQSEAIRAANYAFDNLHARTAYTAYVVSQWGQEYSESFAKEFERLGGKVLGFVTSAVGSYDYRSELSRIKAAHPDVIFAAHVGAMMGNFLKQARQIGIKAPIMAPDEAEEASVLEIAGAAANGLTLLSPVATKLTPTVERFRKEYEALFGMPAGVLAANAYDATVLSARTFKECALDSACVQRRISSTVDFDGVSGTFSILPSRDVKKEFALRVVENGRFVQRN